MIHRLEEIEDQEREELLTRGAGEVPDETKRAVAEIIRETRDGGDRALRDQARRFDGAELDSLRARDQIDSPEALLAPEVREALDLLLAQLREHHRHQHGGPREWSSEARPGIITGERTLPLDDVALYVPGGKGRFPSVMAMLGVPAVLAGVGRIAVCTPASPEGPDPATLYLADRLGIAEVYTVGGSGAIAALAYGTETIPRVGKVIGPGSTWVDEAKRQLAGRIDTGPPAGPSESALIADESADPVTVAREVLVEAEHGPDSRVLLAVTDLRLAEEVQRLVRDMAERLPGRRREFARQALADGPGIVVGDLPGLIELVNDFAPEHLRLLTSDDQAVYGDIRNAGEVLAGPWSSIAIGNYTAGVNAVLPTSGFARSLSCLGVGDFCKTNSFVQCEQKAVRDLARPAAVLAEYEGFPAHRAAAADLLPD